MSLEKAQMTRIPIWAQFYNAPLEYWTAIGISYIASSIGKPLYAHTFTKSCKK